MPGMAMGYEHVETPALEMQIAYEEDASPPALPSVKSNQRLRSFGGIVYSSRTVRITVAGMLVMAIVCGVVTWTPQQQHPDSLFVSSQAGLGDTTELWETNGTCEYHVGSACSAISLLSMPEILDAAAENLKQVGRGLLPANNSRKFIHTAVETCFLDVKTRLLRNPHAAQEWSMVMLTGSEKDSIIAALKLLGEQWVQKLGVDVADAIRGAGPVANRTVLRKHLATQMHGGILELSRLREKLVTKSLQEFWDSEEHQWDLTLELESLHVMRSVSERWRSIIRGWGERPKLAESELQTALLAGALEVARALLNLIKLHTHSQVPLVVTSFGGYLGVEESTISCELDAATSTLNQFFCPLKFGSQGMDALRAFDEIAKVGGDESARAPHTMMVAK